MVSIEESNFDQVFPFWRDHLWPHRVSPIDPTSCLVYGGGKDLNILKTKAYFWQAKCNNQIIGVNSGFATGDHQFRSRGLWVHPDFRGKGVGSMLLLHVIEKASSSGFKNIWSMPRKSSIAIYEKVGFVREGDWFSEDVEFGPNCFVKLLLGDGR